MTQHKIPNPHAFPSATAPSMSGAWGMTVRDFFAAAAIPVVAAILKKDLEGDGLTFTFADDEDMDLLADSCFQLADAMLEARALKENSFSEPVRLFRPTRLKESDEPCIDLHPHEAKVLEILRERGGKRSVRSILLVFAKREKNITAAHVRAAIESLKTKDKVYVAWHTSDGRDHVFLHNLKDSLGEGWIAR